MTNVHTLIEDQIDAAIILIEEIRAAHEEQMRAFLDVEISPLEQEKIGIEFLGDCRFKIPIRDGLGMDVYFADVNFDGDPTWSYSIHGPHASRSGWCGGGDLRRHIVDLCARMKIAARQSLVAAKTTSE